MKELKQGQKVTFDLNEKVVNLTGTVCGKLGPVIIIELDTALKGYDYTHIYVVDSQIK
jgi:hypothetical protein